MVQGFTGGGIRQRETIPRIRQALIRRIRFDEQPVGWYLPESFALSPLAFVRVVAGQRKVRAEMGERFHHLLRPAVTVQQKATRRPGFGLQNLQHPAPRLETMNAHRQISLRRQPQLRDEHFLLPFIRQIRLPAIQSNLAHRRRNLIEKVRKIREPVIGALVEIPRVITETGENSGARTSHPVLLPVRWGEGGRRPGEGKLFRQSQDLRPVGFTRTVHHHAGHAGVRAGREQIAPATAETFVLQMIVRVVKSEAHAGAGSFPRSRFQRKAGAPVETGRFWTALAKRSGDSALAVCVPDESGVALCLRAQSKIIVKKTILDSPPPSEYKRRMKKPLHLIPAALGLVATLIALGCASERNPAHVTSYPTGTNTKARPSIIYVTDFYLNPDQIRRESVLPANGPIRRRLTELREGDPTTRAAKLISVLSQTIVAELNKAGQTAEYRPNPDGLRREFVPANAKFPQSGWLVGGWFVTVDEGNRAEAATIGFGTGAESVEVEVVVSDLAQNAVEPFLYLGADSDPRKMPGGLVMGKNPYAMAAKFVLSRGATERDVKQEGVAIAKNLLAYIDGRGGPAK